MNLGKTKGFNLNSLYGELITIESFLSPGIPSITVIGLGDKYIQESKERIKSVLKYLKYNIHKKLIINLSPAYSPKIGIGFDLSMLFSVWNCLDKDLFNNINLNNYLFYGEINLNSEVIYTKGALCAALFAENNDLIFVCSKYNEKEIQILPNLKYILLDKVNEFFSQSLLKVNNIYDPPKVQRKSLDHIYGQTIGKKALFLACAGGHHLIFIGAKGTGKTLLCESLENLLPNLTQNQALKVTSIYSYLGPTNIIHRPPWRNIHKTISMNGLFGGGSPLIPGEISLAHEGVLFIDEIGEFAPSLLDTLRIPLEKQQISLSRVKQKITFPANFQLIASMNPCKCGKLLTNKCKCNNLNYLHKLSEPLRDRIDIQVVIGESFSNNIELPWDDLERIHQLQYNRQGCKNSIVPIEKIKQNLSPELLKKLLDITNKYQFSFRGMDKILRISQTLADIDNCSININHILEAVSFRIKF